MATSNKVLKDLHTTLGAAFESATTPESRRQNAQRNLFPSDPESPTKPNAPVARSQRETAPRVEPTLPPVASLQETAGTLGQTAAPPQQIAKTTQEAARPPPAQDNREASSRPSKVHITGRSSSQLARETMSQKQNQKRVKGKRISREFIIGSEARKLTDEEKKKCPREGSSSEWRVYIRPTPGGPCLTSWLKRVTFALHETFAPHAVRTVEKENPATGGFELQEYAYGGFLITIKLYFQPHANEKQQSRTHYLQLEPYSNEPDPEKRAAEIKAMEDSGIVRSEMVEIIEFNEPYEQLFDALTSEAQFDYLKPRGKGKNRQSMAAAHADSADVNCGEPPAATQPDQVWSRETEDKLVALFAKAGDESDKNLEQVLTRLKEISASTEQLKAGHDVDDKIKAVYESLPPKKK